MTPSNMTSGDAASWKVYPNVSPSRLSDTAFVSIQWTFYTLAIIMAFIRTGFRVFEFRRIDVDDCFLILAALCLTAGVTVIHFVQPLALLQNKVSLGQYIPGEDFAAIMLNAKKLETTASLLTFFTVYAVKFSYLFFFRKLLQRAKNMMMWWWIVFAITSACCLASFGTDFYICPNFTIDFLKMCPVTTITQREHIWLITTTVLDIFSDSLIITIPFMVLWNVRIPLRAKFGIGAALCLSLCMMTIAIIRIALGSLAPAITDTVWTYFCFSIEASTAVFMVSATAFRSTFGHRRGTKQGKSDHSYGTPMGTMSRAQQQQQQSINTNNEKKSSTKPLISSPRAMEWYDKDELYTKTIYQPEVDELHERTQSLV